MCCQSSWTRRVTARLRGVGHGRPPTSLCINWWKTHFPVLKSSSKSPLRPSLPWAAPANHWAQQGCYCCCSGTKSCKTLCHPTDCSKPGGQSNPGRWEIPSSAHLPLATFSHPTPAPSSLEELPQPVWQSRAHPPLSSLPFSFIQGQTCPMAQWPFQSPLVSSPSKIHACLTPSWHLLHGLT